MESEKKADRFYNQPSFYHQLWQHLKRKWYKKTGRIPEIPWMAQKEQDIVLEIILKLKPARCLEWGSGFSTLYFSNYIPDKAEWISIEHNEEWYQTMQSKPLPSTVNLNFIPANNHSYTDPSGDGSYQDFKDYIEFPGNRFDFIFIDGRARNSCLQKAVDLLSEDGVVIMHDANRKIYHEHMHLFPNHILFRDHRKKFGGIWIGSKNLDLENVLQVKKHQKLWKKHLNLLKVIRPFYQINKL